MSGGEDDQQARAAWAAMCQLVLDDRRRQQVSEAVGLSFGRLRALRRIAEQPRAMGELAARLGIDAPNCTVVVDDLEARGLVERRQHATDRRIKLVAITARGGRTAQQANEMLDRPPVALSALSPSDLRSLNRILARLGAGADR